VDTGHNSFEIAEAFNENNFATKSPKIQNNGQIDVPSFYMSAPIIEAIYNDIPGTAVIIDIEYSANHEPSVPDIVSVNPITLFNENPIPDPEPTLDMNYHIYTGVFDTACIACNPEANIIKSGIVTQSQSQYSSMSQYLESRCRTYAQRESTTKLRDGIYYPSPTNNIPFTFLYPNNDPRGPQVYEPKNCANPKIYNYNPLNTPNNYCSTIYKPNNPQFARQGAVSGSTRIQKLKSDTITSNGFSYYSAYGATMANAGNFQGTNASNNYFVKNRNFPLTGYIALDKYRQHKLSECCNFLSSITTTVYDWRNLAIGQSKTFTTNKVSFYKLGYSIKITYSNTDRITGTITAITGNDITLTITAFTSSIYTPTTIYTSTPVDWWAGPTTPIFRLNPAVSTPNPPIIPANTFITNGESYIFSTSSTQFNFTISILNTSNIPIGSPSQSTTTNPPYTIPNLYTFINGVFISSDQEIRIQANTPGGQPIAFSYPQGGSYLPPDYCGFLQGYTLPYTPLGVITIL
jgi:hypothetical protein